MQVLPDDFVSLGGSGGQVTVHLFHVERSILIPIQGKQVLGLPLGQLPGPKCEWNGGLVPRLGFKLGKIDGTLIQSTRRARLKAADFEAELLEAIT